MLDSEMKDWLKSDKHLGKNVILVSLSGSNLYGLNDKNSDTDYFVIADNSKNDYINGCWEQYRKNLSDSDIKVMASSQLIKELSLCRFEALSLMCGNKDKRIYCTNEFNYIYDNGCSVINKDLICNKSRGFMLSILNNNRKDFFEPRMDGAVLSKDVLADRINTATYLGKYNIMVDDAGDFNISVNMRNIGLEKASDELKKVGCILKDFHRGSQHSNKRSKRKDMAYAVLSGLIACHILREGNFDFTLSAENFNIIKDIRSGKYLTDNGVTDEYIKIIYGLMGDLLMAYDYSKLHSKDEAKLNLSKMRHEIFERVVSKT